MISDTCMSDFLIRERRGQCENRCRGETEGDAMGRQRQRLEGCGHKSRNPKADSYHQRLKEVKKPRLWGCPREHGPVSALISDFLLLESKKTGTGLGVQWLALHAPSARDQV